MAFPATIALIEQMEGRLGCSLPFRLRERLLIENGGEIKACNDIWQLHPVWDPKNRRTIKTTLYNILKETEEAKTWEKFPPDAISIAENGTGGRLIFRPG